MLHVRCCASVLAALGILANRRTLVQFQLPRAHNVLNRLAQQVIRFVPLGQAVLA